MFWRPLPLRPIAEMVRIGVGHQPIDHDEIGVRFFQRIDPDLAMWAVCKEMAVVKGLPCDHVKQRWLVQSSRMAVLCPQGLEVFEHLKVVPRPYHNSIRKGELLRMFWVVIENHSA